MFGQIGLEILQTPYRKQFWSVSTRYVARSFNPIFLHNLLLTVTSWAKVSWHSNCHYNEFCRCIECRYKKGWLYSDSNPLANSKDSTWAILISIYTVCLSVATSPDDKIHALWSTVLGRGSYFFFFFFFFFFCLVYGWCTVCLGLFSFPLGVICSTIWSLLGQLLYFSPSPSTPNIRKIRPQLIGTKRQWFGSVFTVCHSVAIL